MTKRPSSDDPASRQRRQVAALTYRKTGTGELEFLVITSRETRRFILPKGWRMKGCSDAAAAAVEAAEEAGVYGKVAKKPIGTYQYFKRTKRQFSLVEVDVYPLKAKGQRKKWPESLERAQAWLCAEDAAILIDEPQLASLIKEFAELR